MMRLLILFLVAFLAVNIPCTAQRKGAITRADSLRGSITPERAWWNALHYDLAVTPDFATKTITGTHHITFEVLSPGSTMQIDLQKPMSIEKILWDKQDLEFRNDGNIWYVDFPQILPAGKEQVITIQFGGKPRAAVNPPWDGGWIWKKDEKGRPWMTVACQGLGASVWYPCKDHQSDEPDRGSRITITVPDTLVAVANGRLVNQLGSAGKVQWTWEIVNPINNYNIVPYIGTYVQLSRKWKGEKGELTLQFWVLDYEKEAAETQFEQVEPMLNCFEHWFGPYPFYEDGYKLVQAPHLGMEHQSAIAYGNRFRNGYMGMDLSGSGWGHKWDFIIIHESGHEWFGNNITTRDIADMWVHEGFTAYSETLYTECQHGKEAGSEYLIGTRRAILNDRPVIGSYNVNREGSGDMYYKGASMIHTIRHVIDNDSLFREILRGLNRDFYHSTVTSAQIESYISEKSGIDFSLVFNQYLRTTEVPVIEWNASMRELRYTRCVPGFNMPLKRANGSWIHPTEAWQSVPDMEEPDLLPDFYVLVKHTQP